VHGVFQCVTLDWAQLGVVIYIRAPLAAAAAVVEQMAPWIDL